MPEESDGIDKLDLSAFEQIRGFMHEDEALRLYELSLKASENGPVLELGSYCGKSAFVIGSACRRKQSILFSVDHHRGSEEQQPGEEYFESDLLDPVTGSINTFPFFRSMIDDNGLGDTVIPIVGSSLNVGRMWATPLSMVFIDGGHAEETVRTDFETWEKHIIPGGFLLFHDIYMSPEEGGQAPRTVYEQAAASGRFIIRNMTRSLGVLEKKRG